MPRRKKTPGRQKYRYTKNPTSLTRFLKAMLLIGVTVSIISLISNFLQLNLLSSPTFSQVEADANDARQQIIFMLSWIIFILTGITFLLWVYRANLNCHGFDAQGMRFSPGWSVGYFFIPVFNLFEPYFAMKEIWQVSTDPTEWRREMGGPLIGWWWALWLISLLILALSFLLPTDVASIDALRNMTMLSVTSSFTDILLFIVALLLVSAIYNKQEELVGLSH